MIIKIVHLNVHSVFIAQAGTDLSSGLGLSEKSPLFRENIITLLLLVLFFSFLRSRAVKKDDAFSLRQYSGRTMKVPSSSLSSLLISWGTKDSNHLGLSFSDMAWVLRRVAFRALSFYKDKDKDNTNATIKVAIHTCMILFYLPSSHDSFVSV